MRKRSFVLIILLLLLMLSLSAIAEEMNTVTFMSLTVDKTVETIDLGDVVVKDYDAFCAFLDRLPNLTNVDMFATNIRRSNIEMLAERYPNITFGWTMCVGDHLVRTGATAFSTLHNNQSQEHSSKDFSVLKYCTKLLALDIGHNRVDDLSFLSDMTQLRVLILACNKIEDISPLTNLTNLEYLELFKNNIKDVSALSGMTKLLDLNLCFNRISDLSPLESLTQLERLWLYNSNNYTDKDYVSKETIASLQAHMPNVYIDYKSYSTLGGWREHERYFIINDMFKSGEYIPFAESEPTSGS